MRPACILATTEAFLSVQTIANSHEYPHYTRVTEKKLSQTHGSPALLNRVWFNYSLLIEVRCSLTLCSFMNTEKYAMKTLY